MLEICLWCLFVAVYDPVRWAWKNWALEEGVRGGGMGVGIS